MIWNDAWKEGEKVAMDKPNVGVSRRNLKLSIYAVLVVFFFIDAKPIMLPGLVLVICSAMLGIILSYKNPAFDNFFQKLLVEEIDNRNFTKNYFVLLIFLFLIFMVISSYFL